MFIDFNWTFHRRNIYFFAHLSIINKQYIQRENRDAWFNYTLSHAKSYISYPVKKWLRKWSLVSQRNALPFIDISTSAALCVTRVRQKSDGSLIARIGIVQADRCPHDARIIRAYMCVFVYVYVYTVIYGGTAVNRAAHTSASPEKRVSPISLLASMNPARRHVINGHHHRVTRSVGRAHPAPNTFRSIYRRSRRRIIIISSGSWMPRRGTLAKLSIQCQCARRR